MKKIGIYIFFALCAMSCVRDNLYEQLVNPPIKVVEGADLAFYAAGGEGYIKIEDTKETLTAKTESPWCHITVGENNKIDVKVDQNAGLESRYAVVLLSAGESNGKTIIHQYGVIVKDFDTSNRSFNNAARDFSIPYNAHESLMEINCEDDWVSTTVSTKEILVHLDENADKTYRESEISWNVGAMKGSFTISQFDIAEAGLLGAWKWTSTQSNNRAFPMTGELKKQESDGSDTSYYTLTMSHATYALSLEIKNITMYKNMLMIPLGQPSGKYTLQGKDLVVFPIIASGTVALTYDAAITSGALPFVLEKGDDGIWKATADNSSYMPTTYFRLEAWADENHEGTSTSRFSLKTNIVLTKD